MPAARRQPHWAGRIAKAAWLLPTDQCAVNAQQRRAGAPNRHFLSAFLHRIDKMATNWLSRCGRCIKRAYRQEHSGPFGKNLATFSKNAIGCHVFGRHPMAKGGQNARNSPGPQKPGKLVSWTPENSDFVRAFVQSRKDQPVLLLSRAICRLGRIFSEIL